VANNERAIDGRRNCKGVVRDSSVGIATRLGVFGPRIKSRRGRDFPHLSRPILGPTKRPVQRVPALFPGEMRPGRGVDHAPPLSTEVKETVELYLCSLLGLHGLLKVELYLLQ